MVRLAFRYIASFDLLVHRLVLPCHGRLKVIWKPAGLTSLPIFEMLATRMGIRQLFGLLDV